MAAKAAPLPKFKFRPLLQKALAHSCFFEQAEGGLVAGEFDASPDDRREASLFLFEKDEEAGERFERGVHHTKIVANPKSTSLRDFIRAAAKEVRPPADKFNLAFGLASGNTTRGVRSWGQVYSRAHVEDPDTGGNAEAEDLHTTLVAFAPDGAPVGFFRFSVSVCYWSDSTDINIGLPLVYVLPSCRRSTYGIDLAIATGYCLKDIYEGVCAQYRRRVPLALTLNADFDSKGGERIAGYIGAELRVHRDYLCGEYLHMEDKLEECSCDMGY